MDKIFNRILCLTGFLLSFSVYSVFSGRLLSVLISPEVAVKKVEDLLTFGYTLYSLPAIQHMIFNNQVPLRTKECLFHYLKNCCYYYEIDHISEHAVRVLSLARVPSECSRQKTC